MKLGDKLKQHAKKLALTGMVGASALFGNGCATMTAESSGPGGYYNCDQLNYERIQTVNQQNDPSAAYVFGAALKFLAPGAGSIAAARATDIAGGVAIGHGHAVASRENNSEVIVRKRDWVIEPDNSYSAGYLEWVDKNNNGAMDLNERIGNGRAFNLSAVERNGYSHINFSTPARIPGGGTVRMWIYCGEPQGNPRPIYTDGKMIEKGAGDKIVPFSIPVSTLKTFEKDLLVAFAYQYPGREKEKVPVFNHYRITLCCPGDALLTNGNSR